MARYTCLFTVATPVDNLQRLLGELLESCKFDIIYQTEDYLMAREIPGGIAFSKLVVVEVLIDRTTATDREVRMNIVIKNEELPLQVDNHCRQMFNVVSDAIAQNRQIQLIEAVAG
ncbi:hypothetical protein H6F43_04845 [Leptolyngbya sp. FACHB-36]|uniref:hypothetical protein n=1 Tax=Leptolyngbya sp. FACHB-36 TaxID=2692808 RepID=UPI001680DAC0|nr:hypothetical protein [Leptolyngbya sp. FACHB-36]MBD2019512.1 hypothetical protein [Leptolyngbya sp. FACHB-36]